MSHISNQHNLKQDQNNLIMLNLNLKIQGKIL